MTEDFLVWTEAYSTFILGGDVHAPVGTRLCVGERLDLGGGFHGYLIQNPRTCQTFIAEATTGAIVGPSLKDVREDIRLGDPDVMRKQVEDATERRKKVRYLPPEEFWGRFKG